MRADFPNYPIFQITPLYPIALKRLQISREFERHEHFLSMCRRAGRYDERKKWKTMHSPFCSSANNRVAKTTVAVF